MPAAPTPSRLASAMVRDNIPDGQRNKPGTPISDSFWPLLADGGPKAVRAADKRVRVDPSAAARGVHHLAVVRSRQHSRADGNPPEPGAQPDAPAVRTMERRIPPLSCAFSTFDPRRCERHHGQLFRPVQSCYFLMCFQGMRQQFVPTRRDTKNAIRRPAEGRPRFFRSGRGGSSWCQRLRGGPAAPQGRRQDRRSGCAAACLL
jgi:hypothetical protein